MRPQFLFDATPLFMAPWRRNLAANHLTRVSQMMAVVLIALVSTSCEDEPIAAAEGEHQRRLDSGPSFNNVAPVPILAEPLTGRHVFTDNVAMQLRVMPHGRPNAVVNLQDASNVAVVRFTIQPGVRFPWHTHPGSVIVNITQGELVFVYADDCVRRPYNAGTAFVDPGFGNVHYAFNPTGGETVIVATFLGVPPAPAPLTNPVAAAEATALDAKCNVAAALAHMH